jgi:23S rRNA (adenine2030-N6)-methyltransferase
MNYQHLYHAGGHADVFKHLALSCLLNHFRQKSKPFCYIDTHAGCGEYSLTQGKNTDHLSGINILQQKFSLIKNHFIKQYAELQKDLSRFKGSPLVAKTYLRNQDEMILIEKADEPFQRLKKIFGRNKQVHLHHLDAHLALKSLLPPNIKRGLVLIDPIYEENNEHELWLKSLENAINKFPTACYALWFPIKSHENIQYFYNKIKLLSVNSHSEKLILEFCPLPTDIHLRLNGSGLLMINPPYQFEQQIQSTLQELIELLKQHPGASINIFKI